MIEREVVVRHKEGLHARPATQFVKLARTFTANIDVVLRDKTASAKSSVKLMLLGVKELDVVVLRVVGDDEILAADALTGFLLDGEAAPKPDEHSAIPAAVEKVAPAAKPIDPNAPLRGVPASEGCAIGQVYVFDSGPLLPPRRLIAQGEVEAERQRLLLSGERVHAELVRRAAAAERPEEAEVLAALIEIGKDEELWRRKEDRVRSGVDATTASLDVGAELGAEFEAANDPYLQARGDDIRAFTRRVAFALEGRKEADLGEAPFGAVVVAEDISAFDLIGAPLERLSGIVCRTGAATSHVAIIARAAGLPAVLGVDERDGRLAAARRVAFDGSTGEVHPDPGPALESHFVRRIAEERDQRAALEVFKTVEPRTRNGRLVTVAANIGSVQDIEPALHAGAMGVGLFRTELLFMGRKRMPSEDQQTAAYGEAVAAFAPHPVIIRTLDVGGDKSIPGLTVPKEENPFLGWRGIRLTLDRPDIFKPQLRALLRAATRGDLKVMLPMVADVQEIVRTKALIAECRSELDREGVECGEFDLGVMVETPAAALNAAELARESAFFSIGTNDLTQYVMAADRMNPNVAALNRPDHPAVLKAIEMVCAAARDAGIWVGVCGEAAARPDLIPIFVEMGVSELSMSAASIARAKKCVTEL